MRLACLLSMLASGAVAQDMTREECAGLLSVLPPLVALGSPTVDQSGACLLLDQVLFEDRELVVKAKRITWRATGVARVLNDALPPDSLEVIATDIVMEPSTGDVVMDYLLKVQAARDGIDLILDAAWDQTSRTYQLRQVRVDFGSVGFINATASIANVDPTDWGTLQLSLGQAALTDATAEVVTDGLFERYLLISGGQMVLRGEADPARAVAIIKNHTMTAVESFESASLPSDSVAALSAFIEDMPNPTGRLNVHMSSAQGVSLPRVMPFAMGLTEPTAEAILARFEDVLLDIDWTSAP